MNLRHPVLLALLASTACTSAIASEDIGLSKQHVACLGSAREVTAAMIACHVDEAKRQDLRLNKAYKATLGTLEAPRKVKLQEAQRAWIRFRDTNCDFYDDPGGGTFARLSANECVMSSTARRAAELESLTR